MTNPIRSIVFFDGVCNLCNSSVQTILKNDKKGKFHFASLQSDFANEFFDLQNYQPPTSTLIYFNGKRFYNKTGAVLRIALKLKFPYPLFAILFIFPAFMRDFVYDTVAKNRYRWFGKSESCMMPQPQWKSRFLD